MKCYEKPNCKILSASELKVVGATVRLECSVFTNDIALLSTGADPGGSERESYAGGSS